jgi:hypothetical protein
VKQTNTRSGLQHVLAFDPDIVGERRHVKLWVSTRNSTLLSTGWQGRKVNQVLYNQLKRCFEKSCVKDGLAEECKNLLHSPDRVDSRLNHQYGCVIDQLRRANGTEGASYNRHSGKVMATADDRCVDNGAPCGYIRKNSGKHYLVFVPLPAHLREGKDWTDLGYWVKK